MPQYRRLTRRAWRRMVADEMVARLDAGDELFLVGSGYEDRREMLRVATLFPDDVVAELFEDPYHPGYTFMELRLLPAPARHAPRGRRPERWDGERRLASSE